MAIPAQMWGLIQRHDGNAVDPSGQVLETLAPYLEYAEVSVPTPGPGQALVKMARAAVNPSDVAFIKGIYGQPRRKGVAAGFEGTGTVVAGDTPLVGRRVSFFGSGTGTWAEYALTDASGLIPVADDVSDDDAAGLIVNPITAAAMFEQVKASGTGSFIATAASSQLGKFLVALGHEAGRPCIAVIRREGPAAALSALGAAEVLVSDWPDYDERMRAALDTHAPGVLLDAVSGPVSSDLFFAMPNGALWMPYGRLSPEPPVLTEMAQFIFREKRIEGFWLTHWFNETPREEIAAVIAAVQNRFATGTWRTEVSDVIPISQAMNALPDAYSAKDSKVLLAP